MIRPFVAAVAALAAVAGSLSADDFSLSSKNTTISFVGTKPGGKHDGGFKQLTGAATIQDNDATTLRVTVEIDMNSLYADNGKLTIHLKSPDFFSVKTNPKSKFVSSKVEKAGDGYKISGDLTMCGKTQSLSFPAKINANGGALAITSKFSLDPTQWGMTYGR